MLRGFGAYSTTAQNVQLGYRIKLKVTSGAGYEAVSSTTLNLNGITDTWTVTTEANTAPVVNDQTFTAQDGAAAGSVLGTISAYDANSDSLSFSSLDIDSDLTLSAAGVLTVSAGVTLDMSTTASYSFTVTVDDGNDTDSATITVSVTSGDYGKVLHSCIRGILKSVLH